MSCASPEPEPTDGLADAPDPSVARALRRLRLLEELTEIGMDLARALRAQTLGATLSDADAAAADDLPGEAPAPRKDPADAFSRLSRAIRLTLALEAKTDEALRALEEGVGAARARDRLAAVEHARLAGEERLRDREARIRDRVAGAAGADLREAGDWERLEIELDERLMIDEAFWSDPDRPLREIVDRYCAYFRLTPDWSRWEGEDWAAPDIPDPPDWPWAGGPRAPDGGSPYQPCPPPTSAGMLGPVHALE